MYRLKKNLFLLVWFSATAVYAQDAAYFIKTNDNNCYGKNEGSISITTKNLNVEYKIKLNNLSKNSSKYIQGFNDSTFVFDKLLAGKFQLSLLSYGKKLIDTIVAINEPDPLKMNKIKIIQKPSSDNTADGIIAASAVGGMLPYTYIWSENTGNLTSDTIKNLDFGVYSCTITDASNCEDNSKRMNILLLEEFLTTEN